jgi:hypothetical protein
MSITHVYEQVKKGEKSMAKDEKKKWRRYFIPREFIIVGS